MGRVRAGPRAHPGQSELASRREVLPAVVVMLAGPSIAGLLLTGLLDGRAGYRHLFSRLGKWRVGSRRPGPSQPLLMHRAA